MKRLVFKKWVEVTLTIIWALGLFIIAAFDWNTMLPYLIGFIMMVLPLILIIIYGR
jgi:hypothetical protein